MKKVNKNCDSHFHIFGPSCRYPYSQDRSYTPSDASLGDFFNLLHINNIGRAVIIQPSVYNFDNSLVLEALKANPSELRAIVVIEDTHNFEELKKWNDHGVRGVRVNFLFNSEGKTSDVRKLAKLIKPLGWHLELLINVSTYKNLYEEFKDIDVDIVFDHMGNFDITKGLKQKGFQDMLRLLKENKAWVKLSAPYNVSKKVYAPYSDVIPFTQEIIKNNEDRIVWASNWPHPIISVPRPSYNELVDLVDIYTNKELIIKKIKEDNPEKLYGFGN